MKVALITDSHHGIRNDNISFHDMTKKFLDGIFFPTIDERKIQRVYHLGDLVDKRKQLNIYTAKRLSEDFLEPLHSRELDVVFLVGNHDCYHKNSNEVNAFDLVLRDYPKFSYYTSAIEREGILLVPWICDANRQQTMEEIEASKARFCFGHLELAGSQMYRGVVNEHGDDKAIFDKFEGVYTGHFHHKSSVGNIHYLGSHGQFTWSDYGDRRGFHIFDTETGELEFIQNPYDMFIKIGYDDTQERILWNLDGSKEMIVMDRYVKIVVRNKTKQSKFDKLMTVLQDQQPLDIQIIDEAFNTEAADSLDLAVNTEDTMAIFKQHIDSMDPDVPKEDLERCIFDLYKKAKELVL